MTSATFCESSLVLPRYIDISRYIISRYDTIHNIMISTCSKLSKLVQKIFSFVATSVPSECIFSTSGNVINEKRNCLISEHADQLIFLFENHS